MSDDKELSVKFTSDIHGLLQGMKDSQGAIQAATEGIQGDLGSLIESFEKVGTASLALGAVGLAFEALKKGFDYVGEAVEKTYELAETFKVLQYATGASVVEMNQYTAAMELSGGGTEQLQSLMVGMQRGIKANSDVLIANGVASDKAALQGMSFVDYMEKVHEIADRMATPTERMQFLILALGRSGAMAGAQLGEFVENLKKTEGAKIVTDASMAQMDETKQSIGRLKIAQQEYAATVSASATPIANFFRDLHTGFLQGQIDSQKALEDAKALYYLNEGTADRAREQMHAKGMSGGPVGEGKQKLVDKEDLAAQKAATAAAEAERLALAKGSAEEELKIAVDSVNARIAADKHLVDMGALDYDEMIANSKAAAMDKLEAEQAEGEKEIALAQGKASVIAAIRAKMADQEREYQKTIQTLDAQSEKHWLEGVQAEAAEEQKFADLDRKIHEDIAKDIEKNQKKRLEGEMRILDQITSGWDVGIQKMLHGQMSLKDGVEGAMRQMESMVEKSIINMGLQWLKYFVLQQIEGDKAHMTQVMTNAKSAAAAAWNATVGIPFIGPVLAPIAAAASFTGVMAFAEGGWDRVPSDQVAMIHKNEMVLPANIANPLRESLASGGGFGGGNHLHIHAIDAAGVASFVKRPEVQAGFLGLFGSAMRNGRRS